ncbi:hypothetical protein EAH89_13705 [Roseomonas nepalensis]|uniref:Helicase n=1 Tax=Muricoccus nepalensis TaxID=1854500 RepID=A0A502G2H4_9PROT|nr:DISARM system helicase DrmA [Roseomonas nepalensis]TPG55985.1 hypothetical protein EAH89_13705 [Roseomonas nepalensis]
MDTLLPPKTAAEVRAHLLTTLRRDLIGPNASGDDADLSREKLIERPSRWYLTGFIAPEESEAASHGDIAAEQALLDDAMEAEGEPQPDPVLGGQAEDNSEPDPGAGSRRMQPTSLGLTVLLRPDVREIEAVITWGDYRTEPPLSPQVLTEETAQRPPEVQWHRLPREVPVRLAVPPDGRASASVTVPDSAAPQLPGGGLILHTHARSYDVRQPDGTIETVRALTVVLVNRRRRPGRRYLDVSYAFQAQLELRCPEGFVPRCDLSGHWSEDTDRRVADLHYRDVAEYAVGRSSSADWTRDVDGRVRRAWTDPLPTAEVERVAPNEAIGGVTWSMEKLAALAQSGADALSEALANLPRQYANWIAGQAASISGIPGPRRQETARTLVEAMNRAQGRIEAGIALLATQKQARLAFAAMNESLARAARQRGAQTNGRTPEEQSEPRWRPFQIAFILLNLSGLFDKRHDDREVVDLLFFPTGGGKTEAYLGLAAWSIAFRRLSSSGKLGAGVAVLMRYTLRLLTLDQLGRAAGVVCALELMRGEPAWQDGGRPMLGTWPIEIGLYVGSAASPNSLGGKGNTGPDTAVTRIKRYQKDRKEAPAPLQACPWCGTSFSPQSFSLAPNANVPQNMELRCVSEDCAFTGDRPLPIVVVDDAIYRRLPAFIIATVDKFAGLPWVERAGTFFGHVDREDQWGFYGPAEPKEGKKLHNGWRLDPPDLVIQDELHLISGPLGTVAGLYETALDRLSSREQDGKVIRPKIVASTATVRRAGQQIQALFDRERTEVFPPPGPDRHHSFFAETVPAIEGPARLYVGLAAQGKGPKLVFLRALVTLLAAGMHEQQGAGATADPYMTAVCYFNALRELGGARRIVEDEVKARLTDYGVKRRRVEPMDQPFADRTLGEPLELTSRVSTDQVAKAKAQLEQPCDGVKGVDVALATNMISVGLDITRLGLMLVQGQPKTASEYIQATSRVGRDKDKPGLVLAVLNVHKPRDRMHYEQFRHFHACFYRAVEPTSVTPWASRALDRALAAVVVAIARHLDPALTREAAVRALGDHPGVRQQVRDTLTRRAPAKDRATVGAAVDRLFEGWMLVAEQQTSGGDPFSYGRGAQRLLHDPLDPALPTLMPTVHRDFTAGRSMRDVEATVLLKVRGPHGEPVGASS